MIDLTLLNGSPFSLNEQLIEIVENIPETKISLTNGKYYLVKENREEINRKIVRFEQRVFRRMVRMPVQPNE